MPNYEIDARRLSKILKQKQDKTQNRRTILLCGTGTTTTQIIPITYRFLFIANPKKPDSATILSFSEKEWIGHNFEEEVELMAANLREEGYDIMYRKVTPELARRQPIYNLTKRANREIFGRTIGTW